MPERLKPVMTVKATDKRKPTANAAELPQKCRILHGSAVKYNGCKIIWEKYKDGQSS